MNSHPSGLEDLQERVVKLEQQNRRFKQLGAAGLAIAAVITVMGQAPSKKTVEANEFILRDSSGNVRAKLEMLQDGPALALKDSKGKNRGIFGFSESRNNTLLAVFDMDGNLRGQFAEGSNGATVELYDSKKAVRGIFSGGENGAGLVLVDAKGSVQTALTGSSVDVFDDQGFEATLGIKDLGNSRTGETHQTSAASLVLLDKNKNVIWKAP